MDFFHQQDVARRYSKWMVFLFIIAVICVVAAITGLSFLLVSPFILHPEDEHQFVLGVKIIMGTALVTLLILLLGSLYRSYTLSRGGGKLVAETLGARLLTRGNAKTLKERQYLNIVEEMALASGIPVPPAYVMDNEGAINAFAAGNTPEDAVVSVTRGTLESLNREELQGVIGHEFSHILNGDMNLNIRLMGVIYGITLIYLIGLYIVKAVGENCSHRSKDDKGDGGALLGLIALGVMIIGLIGLFFGNVIKAALSRQREYLADASAVQFTRNPYGIANALKKIGGFSAKDQKIKSPRAAEASHLFFSEFSTSFWAGLFATHPPLHKRIARLDPNFNKELAAQMKEFARQDQELASSGLVSDRTSGLVSGRSAANNAGKKAGQNEDFSSVSGFNRAVTRAYEESEGSLGQMLNEKHSGRGPRAPRKEESETAFQPRLTISQALANPLSASAYVLALLTDREKPETAAAQKEIVAKAFDGSLVNDWSWLKEEVALMTPAKWLMHLKMAVLALRQLSLPQYKVFRKVIQEMIDADHVVDLNEFIIYSTVCRQLDIVFELTPAPRKVRPMTLESFRAAVLILSRVAYAGSNDPKEQQKAFRRGLNRFSIADAEILPLEACTNEAFKKALQILDRLEIRWKRDFLNACAMTIETDGVVTENEAFLRYGIAAALGIYA